MSSSPVPLKGSSANATTPRTLAEMQIRIVWVWVGPESLPFQQLVGEAKAASLWPAYWVARLPLFADFFIFLGHARSLYRADESYSLSLEKNLRAHTHNMSQKTWGLRSMS